jgi:hypothetical protein
MLLTDVMIVVTEGPTVLIATSATGYDRDPVPPTSDIRVLIPLILSFSIFPSVLNGDFSIVYPVDTLMHFLFPLLHPIASSSISLL